MFVLLTLHFKFFVFYPLHFIQLGFDKSNPYVKGLMNQAPTITKKRFDELDSKNNLKVGLMYQASTLE